MGVLPSHAFADYVQNSSPEEEPMTITVEAVYENGVLRPKQPLALTEGTEVRLTISPLEEDYDPLDAVIGIGDGPPDGADNHDKYLYGRPHS